MATRFYQDASDATGTPDVSPAVDGVWDDASRLNRRKLVADTPPNVLNYGRSGPVDIIGATAYFLIWQFVSEPLDAISATFAVSKAAFRCIENNAKLNAVTHVVFRKCDGDGSNPVTIGSITDDVE